MYITRVKRKLSVIMVRKLNKDISRKKKIGKKISGYIGSKNITNALPQNVVCCVKKPGMERYGVKMLFETRQIRVGSRFKDTKSASLVAKHFRKIVRISESGRFFISEDDALKLKKETNDAVRYYLKFSQQFKVEHVVDFLIGWVQYMKNRPSPKPRKRRRNTSEEKVNKKRRKRQEKINSGDNDNSSNIAKQNMKKKKTKKNLQLRKNYSMKEQNALVMKVQETLLPDVFLRSAHILKCAKLGDEGNNVTVNLSEATFTDNKSKTIFKTDHLVVGNNVYIGNSNEESDDDEPVSMTREHSFGHESPNSITHSPTESSWQLLSKLIDAERKKHELKLRDITMRHQSPVSRS